MSSVLIEHLLWRGAGHVECTPYALAQERAAHLTCTSPEQVHKECTRPGHLQSKCAMSALILCTLLKSVVGGGLLFLTIFVTSYIARNLMLQIYVEGGGVHLFGGLR